MARARIKEGIMWDEKTGDQTPWSSGSIKGFMETGTSDLGLKVCAQSI